MNKANDTDGLRPFFEHGVRYGKLLEVVADRPLALTFADDVTPYESPLLSLCWTPEGLKALQEFRAAVEKSGGGKWSLPHRSLVALLELEVPGIARVRKEASLRSNPEKHDLNIAWIDGTRAEVEKGVLRAVHYWITGDLAEAARRRQMARGAYDRVQSLYNEGKMSRLEEKSQRLYPWPSAENGTANPLDGDVYQALADRVVRLLEGEAVLEGLSPLRRIVSRFSRFGGNEAHLMTDPVPSKEGGLFSLVIKIQVASVPGVGQPILNLDVGKRRWTTELDRKPFGRTTVGAYALPEGRAIAASFSLEVKGGAYSVGPDYGAIARRYRLPSDLDAFGIARGDAHTDLCRVYVNLRHGYGFHSINAGVPEREKLEAFERVAEILAPAGFTLWDRLRPIVTKNVKSNSSGLLDVKALEIDPGTFEDEERTKAEKRQADAEKIIERNMAALRRHHSEDPLLVIAYHKSCGEAARRLEEYVDKAMGGILKTTRTPIPDDAHGPRSNLPTKHERNERRARSRREAWKATAEGIRRLSAEENVVGCLVIAPDWYEFGSDDTVNKEAGRQALASMGHVLVQYLLPPQRRGKDDFLLRAQNALGDLLWAHQGRVDVMQDEVERLFPDGNGPEEIIGIAVVRRNKKPGGREGSVLPIAVKLDVREGRCFLRFAQETTAGPSISGWLPMRDALCKIAAISPVQSSGRFDAHRACFERFCDEVITESCAAGRRPLVLIHSTHVRGLWRWISDLGLDSQNIDFRTAGKGRQREWRNARIVRVRLGNSPQIVTDKRASVARLEQGDERLTNEIEAESVIRMPTSPNGVLYRVEGSAFPTYLSMGGKTLHKHKRGASCYRKVELLGNKSVGKTEGGIKLYDLDAREPYVDQWPTPNPIELVVARALDGDSPDTIAECVESLRSGFGHFAQWTTLPAPLFFERVVDDYVAEFDSDNGEA